MNDDDYTCDHCGKTFSYKKWLNNHLTKVHNTPIKDDDFSCDFCNRLFVSKRNLSDHMNKCEMRLIKMLEISNNQLRLKDIECKKLEESLSVKDKIITQLVNENTQLINVSKHLVNAIIAQDSSNIPGIVRKKLDKVLVDKDTADTYSEIDANLTVDFCDKDYLLSDPKRKLFGLDQIFINSMIGPPDEGFTCKYVCTNVPKRKFYFLNSIKVWERDKYHDVVKHFFGKTLGLVDGCIKNVNNKVKENAKNRSLEIKEFTSMNSMAKKIIPPSSDQVSERDFKDLTDLLKLKGRIKYILDNFEPQNLKLVRFIDTLAHELRI